MEIVEPGAIVGLEKRCRACKTPLGDNKRRRHSSFCGVVCRRRYDRERARRVNGRANVSTATAGAIAEYEVATDLLRRGFEVFRAMSPACSCDLIAQKDGRLVRIEVRTAYVLQSGQLRCNGHDGKADVLAMVNQAKREIVYDPAF